MPYISARFEKDTLPDLGKTRVIVRNLDQGGVPPVPSATYFPTNPDDYQGFIKGEWIDDILGEAFLDVASLAEISSIPYYPLNQINEAVVNFTTMLPPVSGAVDVIEIYLPTVLTYPQSAWTSEEFPGTNFIFNIDSVIDNNNIKLVEELPAFGANLSWQVRRTIGFVTTVMGSGSAAVTRRFGMPLLPLQQFIEKRFNTYFDSSVDAQNFVEATKAGMTGLANEIIGASIVSENYTASPTV